MTGYTSASASSALLNELEEQILSGQLQAGRKLPSERALAEQHRVSRPTVRQVVRILAERNLIEIAPGRGSYVRAPTGVISNAALGIASRRRHITPQQVVEARIVLEGAAVQLAAERAEGDELKSLAGLLERLEVADDRLEQVRLDLAFHYGLARASHNPVIEVLFSSIAGLAAELMLRSVGDATVRSSSHPFHRTIFEAVRDGRVGDAVAAMTDHLNVAVDTYGADYNRNLDALAHRALERLLGPGTSLEDVLGDVLPPHP